MFSLLRMTGHLPPKQKIVCGSTKMVDGRTIVSRVNKRSFPRRKQTNLKFISPNPSSYRHSLFIHAPWGARHFICRNAHAKRNSLKDHKKFNPLNSSLSLRLRNLKKKHIRKESLLNANGIEYDFLFNNWMRSAKKKKRGRKERLTVNFIQGESRSHMIINNFTFCKFPGSLIRHLFKDSFFLFCCSRKGLKCQCVDRRSQTRTL